MSSPTVAVESRRRRRCELVITVGPVLWRMF